MDLAEFNRLATSFEGVRERRVGGLLRWQRRGRLIARELDHAHVVVRTSFDRRDLLLRHFPDTFSVPRRFERHMMVVADLVAGDADAIEEAVGSAWRLQTSGPGHPGDGEPPPH